MKFLVTANDTGYDILFVEGPLSGRKVGTVERVRMEEVEVHDGHLFMGYIRAVWGLVLDDAVNPHPQLARALSIGRSFVPMRNPLKGQVEKMTNGKYFAFGGNRSIMAACASLELQEDRRLEYTLNKENKK